MNSRDRVREALNHRRTDIVPYNVEFTQEQLEQTLAAYQMQAAEFEQYLGNHCSKVSYNLGGRYVRPGFFWDEFGVVWDRSGIDKDIGMVTELKYQDSGDSSYVFPEPDTARVREVTQAAVAARGDRFLFGKIGTTYLERAWSLCGFQNFLMYLAIEPDFVQDLLGKVLDYNLKIIDVAVEYDIDGFYFGDDYGQQTGMLMSPDAWRTFIKPGLAEMFQRVRSAGKTVALHSCGNIREILPELVEIGLDVYQTVQPEVYDLAALKRDLGHKLTFWGAISTQRDLPFLSPADLERKITDTLALMSVDGGYIAGPTHRLPADVPLDNVRVLVETLRRQQA